MQVVTSSPCKMRQTPEAITGAIEKGGFALYRVINQVIEDLCKCRYFENTVFKYVLNNGGTRTKAEEVLEDGLVKLSELLRQGKYNGGKVEAFGIQICKNIWLNMRRKKDEQLHLTDDVMSMDKTDYETPESLITDRERTDALRQVLDGCVGEECQKLMQMKFIEGQRHNKIAEILGLANADSSKEKLSRCKKNALKCIETHEHYSALLAAVDFQPKKRSRHGK